jgi:hypothetical protein
MVKPVDRTGYASRVQQQTDRLVLWCFSVLFQGIVLVLKLVRRR